MTTASLAAGDLPSPLGRDPAQNLANLSPRLALCVEVVGHTLPVSLEDFPDPRFGRAHRVATSHRVFDLGEGVVNCGDGGVEGWGHALSVGVNRIPFKDELDAPTALDYLSNQSLKARLTLTGYVRRAALKTENGPDTATLTSQAGPTTRNL